MSENDVAMIKDRLARLETKFDEKWLSHDKRADERWQDLMDSMHELKNNRACVSHAEALVDNRNKVRSLEEWRTAVNWALGVIYVAVVGIIVKKIVG